MKILTVIFYGPCEREGDALNRRMLFQQSFSTEQMEECELAVSLPYLQPPANVDMVTFKITDRSPRETVAGQQVSDVNPPKV